MLFVVKLIMCCLSIWSPDSRKKINYISLYDSGASIAQEIFIESSVHVWNKVCPVPDWNTQNWTLSFSFTSPLFSDIKEQVKHIEKAVSTKEPRYMTRALRSLVPLRRKLNHAILRKAVFGCQSQSTHRDAVLNFLDEVNIYTAKIWNMQSNHVVPPCLGQAKITPANFTSTLLLNEFKIFFQNKKFQ